MRDKIKSNNETDAVCNNFMKLLTMKIFSGSFFFQVDTVKLGAGTEEKYKLRYYEQKFHVKSCSLDGIFFI
jgi:hypothetical protein